MLAWRIAKQAYALDRHGTGAQQSGGRWNSPGIAVVYAGLSAEIAALEKLVHSGECLPNDLVLVKITLPDNDQLYEIPNPATLPPQWNALPSSNKAALYGDAFFAAGKKLGLIVPSAVMPEARIIAINPCHAMFKTVKLKIMREFQFDARLRG